MAVSTDPSTGLRNLISRMPTELVLKIIQHLPFNDGKLIQSIRSAHPRMKAIFSNYEYSITSKFMKKELRHAETDFSCVGGQISLDWLADCVKKYDIIDDVMNILCSEYNFMAVLPQNGALAHAGLLLLYRLLSIGQWLKSRQSLLRDLRIKLILYRRRSRRQDHVYQVIGT